MAKSIAQPNSGGIYPLPSGGEGSDGGGAMEHQRASPPPPEQLPPAAHMVHQRQRHPATVLLRKLLYIHPQEEEPFITLLKDIIIATILSVIILMFLLFLDLRNVIHLRSARGLTHSVFNMLSDPETVASIEEDVALKFVPQKQYEEMKWEIGYHEKAVAEMIKYGLSKYEAEAEEYKSEEWQEVRREHAVVMEKAQKLWFSNWCGHCNSGSNNCNARVQYLKNQYNTPELTAKTSLMKKGRCLLNPAG